MNQEKLKQIILDGHCPKCKSMLEIATYGIGQQDYVCVGNGRYEGSGFGINSLTMAKLFCHKTMCDYETRKFQITDEIWNIIHGES